MICNHKYQFRILVVLVLLFLSSSTSVIGKGVLKQQTVDQSVIVPGNIQLFNFGYNSTCIKDCIWSFQTRISTELIGLQVNFQPYDVIYPANVHADLGGLTSFDLAANENDSANQLAITGISPSSGKIISDTDYLYGSANLPNNPVGRVVSQCVLNTGCMDSISFDVVIDHPVSLSLTSPSTTDISLKNNVVKVSLLGVLGKTELQPGNTIDLKFTPSHQNTVIQYTLVDITNNIEISRKYTSGDTSISYTNTLSSGIELMLFIAKSNIPVDNDVIITTDFSISDSGTTPGIATVYKTETETMTLTGPHYTYLTSTRTVTHSTNFDIQYPLFFVLIIMSVRASYRRRKSENLE